MTFAYQTISTNTSVPKWWIIDGNPPRENFMY